MGGGNREAQRAAVGRRFRQALDCYEGSLYYRREGVRYIGISPRYRKTIQLGDYGFGHWRSDQVSWQAFACDWEGEKRGEVGI